VDEVSQGKKVLPAIIELVDLADFTLYIPYGKDLTAKDFQKFLFLKNLSPTVNTFSAAKIFLPTQSQDVKRSGAA
jgi:hypothetical protein